MAGVKYKCTTCGLEAWLANKSTPCVQCGGEGHERSVKTVLPDEKCSECKTVFTPKSKAQKTCCTECSTARDRRKSLERAKNCLSIVRCRYCGASFRQRVPGQTACSSRPCRVQAERDRHVSRRARIKQRKDNELLGPEFPEMPMRKCHERGCNEMTYDYRCERCRAKWRAREGASGLSGLRELFSGAYLSPTASSSYAS